MARAADTVMAGRSRADRNAMQPALWDGTHSPEKVVNARYARLRFHVHSSMQRPFPVPIVRLVPYHRRAKSADRPKMKLGARGRSFGHFV